MTEQRKVLLIQDTGHDYDKATKFGELIVYTVGPVNVFSNDRLKNLVGWVDRNFSKDDYLLMTGSLVLNCVAVSYLLRKHGEINTLVFHNGDQTYRSLQISNGMLEEGGKEDGSQPE